MSRLAIAPWSTPAVPTACGAPNSERNLELSLSLSLSPPPSARNGDRIDADPASHHKQGWSVSFCSRSSHRRCMSGLYNAQERPNTPTKPTHRQDINMRRQHQLIRDHHDYEHASWVETTRAQTIARAVKDEQHYLKILIGAALVRQDECSSTKLASSVMAAYNAKDYNDSVDSDEKAFSRAGVAEKLSHDIELVHKKCGYKATLKACVRLNLWDI